MAAEGAQTFDSICRDIRAEKFSPIYLLIGEEPYFIDCIAELLTERVVKEADRDFNQTILYGSEAKSADVINAARRFPMMADRQLVLVREAQALTDLHLQLLSRHLGLGCLAEELMVDEEPRSYTYNKE